MFYVGNLPKTLISDEPNESDEILDDKITHPEQTISLDPYEQLWRIKEKEWKNIPKVVTHTLRLLIDFTLDQKSKTDKASK